MFINIQDKVAEIEMHIVTNQKDIFNMYNYYTKKWKGSRLNDINVGLFLGDGNIPTVQIFVRNKTGYVKKHILFNKVGDRIINIKTLNTTFSMNTIENTKEIIANDNNPSNLEYWKNIFPNKTDDELEEYRVKWGKENFKYLKFERL